MKKSKIIIFSLIIFIAISIYSLSNIHLFDIIRIPSSVYASLEDIEYSNVNNSFGKIVSVDYPKSIRTSSQSIPAKLKLFNLITIKEFNILTSDIDLYVPGSAIGFTLEGDGLVIIGSNSILTENGRENPLENSVIKKGDILISIEGERINQISDINKIINKEENKGRELKCVIKRDKNLIETKIFPKLDVVSNTYKSGIWVKDSISGVGTITFVKKSDNRFGSLGHPINDNDTKDKYPVKTGQVYACNVIGVTKGIKGKPGELRGLFFQGKDPQGVVDKNTDYGVYGKINDDSLLASGEVLSAGGRFVARPGKAVIRTCVDGTESKDYSIEIIKTNYQSASNEKSMVIKVTDSELLKKTGGIVQGMSGSPIIQGGKVIGAVTHVFVKDPTKGFGIYLDWMLNQ